MSQNHIEVDAEQGNRNVDTVSRTVQLCNFIRDHKLACIITLSAVSLTTLEVVSRIQNTNSQEGLDPHFAAAVKKQEDFAATGKDIAEGGDMKTALRYFIAALRAHGTKGHTEVYQTLATILQNASDEDRELIVSTLQDEGFLHEGDEPITRMLEAAIQDLRERAETDPYVYKKLYEQLIKHLNTLTKTPEIEEKLADAERAVIHYSKLLPEE